MQYTISQLQRRRPVRHHQNCASAKYLRHGLLRPGLHFLIHARRSIVDQDNPGRDALLVQHRPRQLRETASALATAPACPVRVEAAPSLEHSPQLDPEHTVTTMP